MSNRHKMGLLVAGLLFLPLLNSPSNFPALPGPAPLPAAESARIGGKTSPAGVPIQNDLPGELHLKNVGGSDGAGLCVATSITHAARYQGIQVLQDFQQWCRKYRGGGWPEKVDKQIRQVCEERGQPVPRYLQVRKLDMEIVKAATKSGRFVCSTYAFSPTNRYRGKVAHMVNIAHADDQSIAWLDNNFPGEENYEWVDPATAARQMNDMGGAWYVIFLDGAPPPPLKVS